MKKTLILILATPTYPNELRFRFDKEIREIEDTIRRAVRKDLFEIRVRNAVRPSDIRRALASCNPCAKAQLQT
ncbi:hypothetical protein F7734_34405 [Scytonema sp. UIC 10036]|uniref:hypothetical protein n=1 Tax=Scytonema sp. UIC 10036 TaxID=2304196 RepID=UPI0012DA94A6|nr:hypothetical protein [Scytonema sp. UIC 10036]MUG97150.1 hypothetical protein [Scytonema sp. UIC 10036]